MINVVPFRAGLPKKQKDYSSLIKTAKKDFSSAQNQYNRPDEAGLYIHNIVYNGRDYTGIVGLTHIQDYLSGRIIKHELTLAEKEQWQMDALKERAALIKPVLLTCPGDTGLDDFLAEYIERRPPDIEADLNNGTVHQFWAVRKGEYIGRVQSILSSFEQVYIADGHHRTEAFAKTYQQSNFDEGYSRFMTAYFSLDNLDIHAYHRVVTDPELFRDPYQSIIRLKSVFEIRPMLDHPSYSRLQMKGPGMFLYFNDQWMQLTWRADILTKHKGEIRLETDLLNEHVFKELFDCRDIRHDTRIKYIDSTRGLDYLKNKTLEEVSMAFVLPSLSRDDFKYLLDRRIILPPKSTLFKPRLKNGLLVQFVNQKS